MAVTYSSSMSHELRSYRSSKNCRFWVLFFVLLVGIPCKAFLIGFPPPTRTRSPNDNCSSSFLCASACNIEILPSRVTLDQVSLQYPITLARKLFSSVPRREFAVDHVSCQFSSEIVLLQGASSSGKSALMKVILGEEEATSGTVALESIAKDGTQTVAAKPIMLAEKPPFDNKRSVRAILQEETKKNLPADLDVSSVVEMFCKLAQLDASLWSKTPADLSPSENYRLRLAEACLQSSLAGATANDKLLLIPAPIVLLDEWMDFETRDSSSKVEEALLELVETTGAVVLCATHKPNLWKKLELATPHTSQMTMCRGEILTLKQHKEEAQ